MRTKTHCCLDHSVTPETSVEINQKKLTGVGRGQSSKHIFSVVATTAVVDCWRQVEDVFRLSECMKTTL